VPVLVEIGKLVWRWRQPNRVAKINSSIGASLRRFVRDVAALAEPETAGIGFEDLFGVGRRAFPVLGRDPTQTSLNGWLYLHWKENLGLDLWGIWAACYLPLLTAYFIE
jgi:hypothetical protein